MNLKEILSISGKPGLYKLISQSRNGVIVESILDGKRFPVIASQNVSTLGDIAIYTYAEEVPLAEVFKTIMEKENSGEALSHKASGNELTDYFLTILPEFDRERVYTSDIKKVLNWYNLLQKNNLLNLEEEAEEVEAAAPEDAESKKDTKEAE